MMHRLFILAVAASLAGAAGCTVRYSRTLVDVGPAGAARLTTSSRGLEILGVELQDTDSAANLVHQLRAKCASLRNVECDYRGTGIFPFFNQPTLTVSADCE
jgi:hypothetical protein